MKTLFVLFVAFCAIFPATAAPAIDPDLPFTYRETQIRDSLRRIGDKTCNLTPLFTWIRNGHNRPGNGFIPMPAWAGFWQYEVAQNLPSESDDAGSATSAVTLLVKKVHVTNPPGVGFEVIKKTDGPYIIRNYPRPEHDGAIIDFVATKIGPQKLGQATYLAFDYGIPLTKAQTAEFLSTNRPPSRVTTARNTNSISVSSVPSVVKK